ncbi:MAG TPA: isoprenylcysteine carboxylmethyltransferase family protein [Acidobacteriota bacterium]|nr:isoprenylcysteine carboxylmethyltransferase family protein [Acidobacteriota bacterium]
MRLIERWRAWASHHRVHAGILFALLYVALSRTSEDRFVLGALFVVLGEAIRLWACGHLVRNVELTRHGPYHYVRNPLYLGSLFIGLGLALLAVRAPIWLGGFALMYLGFYVPTMHVEELRLQSLFGAEYKEYVDQVPRLLPGARRSEDWPDATAEPLPFSWHQARQNRELRTVAVMAALLVVQALKLL